MPPELPGRAFDCWADDFAAAWMRGRPLSATRTQYFSGAEQDALDRRLDLEGAYGGVYGVKRAQADARLARRGLEELARFSRSGFSPEQRSVAAILDYRLAQAVSSAEFAQHRFIFNQFAGLHVSLTMFLSTMHPMRNERDAENYVERLAQVADCLDEGIDEARAAAKNGIVPPHFILERSIAQIDGMIAGDPLAESFERRLNEIAGLSRGRAAALLEQTRALTANRVAPALGRVRALLAEQLPHAGDAAGAWRLPRGSEFYAHELAIGSGSPRSPQEVHEIGLREVARLEAEMDGLLGELGYRGGTIQERVERLNATLAPPSGPDAREAILAQLSGIVEDARLRSQAIFDLQPRAPVVVKREPLFSETSAAAHYTPPAPDGSQPGVYWVPLADLSPRVPWLGAGTKSTAYHEAIPGHHFQIALQQEMTHLPRFVKYGAFGLDFSFVEGWALYAEHVSAENGWYEGDLASRIGYLHMQLFRARRLVVDTGLHELRWTREQAIAYGFTDAEIDRYVVWPGQACAYTIGYLRILEMREHAKNALGARFSMPTFHNLVLRGGTRPLDVVAQEIDSWIVSS